MIVNKNPAKKIFIHFIEYGFDLPNKKKRRFYSWIYPSIHHGNSPARDEERRKKIETII